MKRKQNFKERFKSKFGLLLMKVSTRAMIAGLNLTKHKVKFSKIYKKEPVEVTSLNTELLELVGMEEFNKLSLTEKYIKKTIIRDVAYTAINANEQNEQKFINALESGLYHASSELNKTRDYLKFKEFEVFQEKPMHLMESSPEIARMPKVSSFIFSSKQVEEILEKFFSEDTSSTKQKLEFEFDGQIVVKIESTFNKNTNSKASNLKIFKGESEIFSELLSKEDVEKIVEKIKNSNYGIL